MRSDDGGSKVVPVDPSVRLAIARWPRDAPRGAVSAFCAECGISRNTFYKLRRRAVDEGEAAVLEPRSHRPASSPTRIGDERVAQALRVRAALASSGLDAGPVSVCDKRACQFFCVCGLEVGGDPVGVGGGELGEGLFPVGGELALDETGWGGAFAGGFALVLVAFAGAFVLDVADRQPQ